MNCTKAIILVAGYGTRRLPITKSIEKCMLPVLNRPVVDYIVQDCIAAGIKDFYFVVNEGSRQLPSYYAQDPELQNYLKRNNKDQYLELITPPSYCSFHYVQQPMQGKYGTSVAVGLCRKITDALEADERILVIGGDQFMMNADGFSETKYFMDIAANTPADSAMLTIEVPRSEVSKYGIVATQAHHDYEVFERIIEKPSIEEAPSNLNNGSFFMFNKEFFEFLKRDIERERNGEYFITDVLNQYVQARNEIAVIRNRGEYLDCGSVEGWLHANIRIATLAGIQSKI